NARIRLGQMTDEWSAHSLEIVAQAFWPKGKFHFARLRACLPASVQVRVKNDDVQEIAHEAIKEFRKGSKRISRWVIESAQRRILVGKAPAFAFAETDDEIVRSWRSFVARSSQVILKIGKTISVANFDSVEAPASDDDGDQSRDAEDEPVD